MIMRQLNVAVLLCICLCAGFVSHATEVGYQDWQFTNSANPAIPTVLTNSAGKPTATIMLGYAASGWLESLSSFGTQTGLWDLGMQDPNDLAHDTRGRVQLSIPNPVPATSSTNTTTDFGLRVVQFVDGLFYIGTLSFSIPGAVYLGRTIVETLPGPLGGEWVADQFHWHWAPSPAQVSLTITGAVTGTLLDRITVDTASAVVAPPPLLITSVEKLSHALAISWAGGLPPYQIYVTTNLLSSEAWQAVGSPVSGSSAEIPLLDPVEFVRVRGSD